MDNKHQYMQLKIDMARVRFRRVIRSENDIEAVKTVARLLYTAQRAHEDRRYSDVDAITELVHIQCLQSEQRMEKRFHNYLHLFDRTVHRKLELTFDVDGLEQKILALKEQMSKMTRDDTISVDVIIELGYEQLLAL